MMRVCIFCEGDTEKNYIQSLNRLLRTEEIFDITLTAKDLKGVRINNYFSKIKKYKAHELKYFTDFYYWLDFDIFKRGNKNKSEIQRKIKTISFNRKAVVPLFNHMNGEDFIILHEGKTKIDKWKKVCNVNKHFDTPMVEDTYLHLFKKLMTNYKKGEISDLTKEKMRICIKNIDEKSIPFNSDMKKILEIILDKNK